MVAPFVKRRLHYFSAPAFVGILCTPFKKQRADAPPQNRSIRRQLHRLQAEQQEGGVMISAPRWFLPVAVLAMIWNLLGCAAFLADVTLTHEDVAKMSAAQQALYASRPAWAVAATGIAVWGGAAGCLGLILRKRWATWLLVASLAGVIVQDIGLFVLSKAASQAGPTVFVLQGLVLLVSVGLVLLARKASAQDWIA
jgi:hypothetical protein